MTGQIAVGFVRLGGVEDTIGGVGLFFAYDDTHFVDIQVHVVKIHAQMAFVKARLRAETIDIGVRVREFGRTVTKAQAVRVNPGDILVPVKRRKRVCIEVVKRCHLVSSFVPHVGFQMNQ